MKLIRKLGTRVDKNGYKRSWGEFLCPDPICNKIVERKLSDGNKQGFCGCNKIKFISELNKGKDFSGENNPFYGKNHTEETNQKNRDSHKSKEPWNKGKLNVYSQETIDEMSKSAKVRFSIPENNPMYGIQRFGELNPNWNNGSSFEPYGIEFNKEFKQLVYERDNYTCQCPNCKNKINTLDAHHIDFNKQNNTLENVITLCRSCHTKTNGKNNRQYWTEFYQNIMRTKI